MTKPIEREDSKKGRIPEGRERMDGSDLNHFHTRLTDGIAYTTHYPACLIIHQLYMDMGLPLLSRQGDGGAGRWGKEKTITL